MAMPSRTVANTAARSASRLGPWRQTMKAQMSAVSSSISGYWTEIGAWQPRQRPRSTSHDTMGMLSYHWSPTPHLGQCDGGRTIDSFGSAPQRRMQTLRKLPIIAPNTPAMTMNSGMSGVTRDLIQEDAGGDCHVERLDRGGQGNGDSAARRRRQRGAHAGAFVADHERERRTAAARAAERLAIRGGHHQRDAAGPDPVEQRLDLGRDRRQPE